MNDKFDSAAEYVLIGAIIFGPAAILIDAFPNWHPIAAITLLVVLWAVMRPIWEEPK